MKKKNILAICGLLPFLLGGAYYLNNMFNKYNESRLQACREVQKEIVEGYKIREAVLAEEVERQRIKDGIEKTEKPITKEAVLFGGYTVSKSAAKYPKIEGVSPCTWLNYYAKMMKRTSRDE